MRGGVVVTGDTMIPRKLVDFPISPYLVGLLDVIFDHYCVYDKI